MKRTTTIGKFRITAINDFTGRERLLEFFPDISEDAAKKYEELYPNRISNGFLDPWPYYCFLIQGGGQTILVDAGVGGGEAYGKTYSPQWTGRLPELLREDGVGAEDIDVLVFTHLHPDHVGWSTMLRDGEFRKTFPRARYLVQKNDLNAALEGELRKAFPVGCLETSLVPLFQRGELEVIATDEFCLSDSIRLKHTPGHTPGSMCVVVESQGERAVLVGDLAANPLAVTEPQVGYVFDCSTELAIRARTAFLETLHSGDALGACHFGLGTLERAEDMWYWHEIT